MNHGIAMQGHTVKSLQVRQADIYVLKQTGSRDEETGKGQCTQSKFTVREAEHN